jgi:aarF domain-containing kinase
MEFLQGPRLVDGVRAQYREVARILGTTLEAIEAERRQQIENGTFVFKSLEEASSEAKSARWAAALYDLLFTANALRRVYNTCASALAWVVGADSPAASAALPAGPAAAPIDLGATLQLLCDVHAYEIFEGGHFNGDPHPGNILLLEDGRLGLIDYGQVKSMTLQQRISLAKMIIALRRDDKKEIVRILFEEMGTVTQRRDPETAYKFACFWYDRDTPDILEGRNIADFLDYLQAQDPMVQLPEDYLLAGRVSVLMRGMGNAFGLKMRTSHQWERHAEAFLRRQGIEY